MEGEGWGCRDYVLEEWGKKVGLCNATRRHVHRSKNVRVHLQIYLHSGVLPVEIKMMQMKVEEEEEKAEK